MRSQSRSQGLAVVTGGAGGMGLATALCLGRRGHRLLLVDVDALRLAEARASLSREGIESDARVCDVADADAVRALARACSEGGPLAVVAHTAGLSPTMASGERILAVNLTGTALLLEALVPLLAPDGAAVCVASQAAHFAAQAAEPAIDAVLDLPLAPDLAGRLRALDPVLLSPENAYSLSKRGVVRLVQREASAFGRRGVRIVSLSPGLVDTRMNQQERAVHPMMKVIIDRTPLGRVGRPEEIAAVIDFLCSPDASFVSGVDWLVDGGSTNAMLPLVRFPLR